mmetsp:Transcript_2151/g.5060  ORF Transcript_2151/g.5060 Transcript_2151/m.5060 type:complete len:214 (-) Transcript_2151:187-828(-)|eukprot:CAMPEP_0116842602 /NCGR_PEP_ID=MMETSP0418-20121206/11610_1 /TAXON_ID=1158023 /ORGANISM="Astrosyne radiata, Strain 13vi08-1A" /LENGTH=213 /DNA_ID=CAMNT_0004473235 /DNA_START=105 /DNA_END=746 /DNA_ORIENTATION=-
MKAAAIIFFVLVIIGFAGASNELIEDSNRLRRRLKKGKQGSKSDKDKGGKAGKSGGGKSGKAKDSGKAKGGKSGGGGGGGSGGYDGDRVSADDFRNPSGQIVIPIPQNSVQPVFTPAPVNRGDSPGPPVSVGPPSPTPAPVVLSAPVVTAADVATPDSCRDGSYYQTISGSEHCFGPGTCGSGCCLYPYCLCTKGTAEIDENQFPLVVCLESL